jgi:hypothetical protein
MLLHPHVYDPDWRFRETDADAWLKDALPHPLEENEP